MLEGVQLTAALRTDRWSRGGIVGGPRGSAGCSQLIIVVHECLCVSVVVGRGG